MKLSNAIISVMHHNWIHQWQLHLHPFLEIWKLLWYPSTFSIKEFPKILSSIVYINWRARLTFSAMLPRESKASCRSDPYELCIHSIRNLKQTRGAYCSFLLQSQQEDLTVTWVLTKSITSHKGCGIYNLPVQYI